MHRPTIPQKPVAVVTGASQGLGRALAEALAERGWALVVDARRAERLDGVVARLAPVTRVVGVAGDITDATHRQALADAARTLGTVRLVVNNASTLGASPLPTLDRISPKALRDTFATNVIAPLALLQTLAPVMPDDATIVNITSDAAVEPYEGWGGYGASKAALEHASRILAIEQPARRVLVVDPGDMRTEMHQDAFPDEDITDRPEPAASVPGLVALIEGGFPSGRYEARAFTPAASRQP